MGISAFIGVIALIGFAAFLGGIGLAVVSTSQGRPARGGVLLAAVGLVAGVIFSIISQGIIVVEPTEVAVVFNTLSGDLEDTPRRSGTQIIIPILQTATIYPVQQLQYTMSGIPAEGAVVGDDAVRGRTIDGQEVFLDITVLYNVDPSQANVVHRRWPSNWQDDFVRPTIRGLARDVVSRFQAEEIFGEQREDVQDEIENRMRARMADEGFELTDLLVRDVRFTAEFTQSIENKQIAEQRALEAAFRVQQEEQEAEVIRVRAAGARDRNIAEAEGEAQAIVLRAQANAEALRLVSEQIAANPSLVQYLYVTELSDNVNLALVPSNSPFLFDFASLGEANPNFVAPEVPQPEVPEAETSGG